MEDHIEHQQQVLQILKDNLTLAYNRMKQGKAKQGNLKSKLKKNQIQFLVLENQNIQELQNEALNPRHKLQTFLRSNLRPNKTFQWEGDFEKEIL